MSIGVHASKTQAAPRAHFQNVLICKVAIWNNFFTFIKYYALDLGKICLLTFSGDSVDPYLLLEFSVNTLEMLVN